MNKTKNLHRTRTTIIGGCLLLGSAVIWRIRDRKINREIDEFDRIMHELKIRKVEQYDYYRKEACERKEVTKCCQIR